MKKHVIILGFLTFMLLATRIGGADIAISSTQSSLATKDSYVHSDNNTTNYGDQVFLLFGHHLGLHLTEAYLEFDTSSPPAGWTNAEIEIDMFWISESTQLTVSLVTDAWEELTITWLNKPNHTQEITSLTVFDFKVYKINVANFISGSTLSVCINATTLPSGYVQATSQDGDWALGPGPTLTWTYPTPSTNGGGDGIVVPGYNTFLVLGALSVICGIIIYRKTNKKR
ncbi:MAG: Loki-CTERM sorting domain-containing protein [Promethearchaeota archaeon]|jgi:hypothetical protein